MAKRGGASAKVQNATVDKSMLTPAARARRELEEAKNVDETGARRRPGEKVVDRDGRTWTVQAVHKRTIKQAWHPSYGARVKAIVEITYDITPDRTPDLPDFGYVHRRVTDEDLDTRNFGFKPGTRLTYKDGEFVHETVDFA